MLLYMYQIFSSLRSHLHFLCIFSSLLWSNFFVDTPYDVGPKNFFLVTPYK